MLHHALRAPEERLLFRNWIEARALWDAIATRTPCSALVLMPDHVHVLVEGDASTSALHAAMSAYARWRNILRGESGPVWRHGDRPLFVRDGKHARTTLHYLFLNPCRAGLVDDPLAWPFSSYRDALGLSIPPLHPPRRGSEALHAQLSAKASGRREPSCLPRALAKAAPPSPERVMGAVSSLTRTPPALLRRPGPARGLFIRAARELAAADSTRIAGLLGLRDSTIRGAWSDPVRGLGLVERVVSDPRFGLLVEGDLRSFGAWRRYRQLV